MSGVPIHLKHGPASYVPAEPILGGQLVEARPNARIGVAAAGSTTVVGVALFDGEAPEAIASGTTVVNGRPLLIAGFTPPLVAVAYGGAEVPVTYSAACTFGQRVVTTALGQVGPAGATPAVGAIVGICTDPNVAGVAAGAVGLMRTLV